MFKSLTKRTGADDENITATRSKPQSANPRWSIAGPSSYRRSGSSNAVFGRVSSPRMERSRSDRVRDRVSLVGERLRSNKSRGSESEESGGRLSFGGSSGKVSKGSNSSSSELHKRLAFLEKKVKSIASNIIRTKEMLDLNDPEMLSDIQETVAGIEKAMGDVVKKNSRVKDEIKEYSGDVNTSAKAGLNNDEPEARLFPHHNRTTLAKLLIQTKLDEKPLSDGVENCEIGNRGLVVGVDFDDNGNHQLNEIGNKTCTGGWFLSEGESVLLAHDDGSCSHYDVVNSEVKSVYKPPAGSSLNLWRDCWIVHALGSDSCFRKYLVAASAGNSKDSGFCSWDFHSREIKSFHFDNVVTTNRGTAENRKWWYEPCGPLIVKTATNQKEVNIYDIRDGDHILKWDVKTDVRSMMFSSPLHWRNSGLLALAESDGVSLYDIESGKPKLSLKISGKNITAFHVNNTDCEPGGGVRKGLSLSEVVNDGVFCTLESMNVLDFRDKSGICFRIPKHGTTVQSVFSRGDSVYLGCSGSSSAARKPTSSSQIQQFSLRMRKLLTTYTLPEPNAHSHCKAITQVWGNSNLTMGVSGLGLFVFDALKKDDGSRPVVSDYGSGRKVRETIGPDNLHAPTFDYLGSRALLISRDRPACWKYLS